MVLWWWRYHVDRHIWSGQQRYVSSLSPLGRTCQCSDTIHAPLLQVIQGLSNFQTQPSLPGSSKPFGWCMKTFSFRIPFRKVPVTSICWIWRPSLAHNAKKTHNEADLTTGTYCQTFPSYGIGQSCYQASCQFPSSWGWLIHKHLQT